MVGSWWGQQRGEEGEEAGDGLVSTSLWQQHNWTADWRRLLYEPHKMYHCGEILVCQYVVLRGQNTGTASQGEIPYHVSPHHRHLQQEVGESRLLEKT